MDTPCVVPESSSGPGGRGFSDPDDGGVAGWDCVGLRNNRFDLARNKIIY